MLLCCVFLFFCECRGLSHSTDSDLFLFLFKFLFETEFGLGTAYDKLDIIPRITIGNTQSGSVAIVAGELWLNGNNTGRSISEFTVRSGVNSTEDLQDTYQDFKFMSEPGRCLYIKLYAVGYSHLSSEVKTDPVCIASKIKEYIWEHLFHMCLYVHVAPICAVYISLMLVHTPLNVLLRGF